MRFRKFAVVPFVLVAASGASAQTLANGDFAGDASGWNFSAPFGGYSNGAGSDGAAGYFWINSNGGAEVPFIEQSITGLATGGIYEVSGFYATLAIFNSGDPFRVLIDGVLQYSDDNRRSPWAQFSFQFTATGASALLRFEAEVTADSDWAVDTIKVKEVPAPGAMGLLGVAGLAGLRRRR